MFPEKKEYENVLKKVLRIFTKFCATRFDNLLVEASSIPIPIFVIYIRVFSGIFGYNFAVIFFFVFSLCLF